MTFIFPFICILYKVTNDHLLEVYIYITDALNMSHSLFILMDSLKDSTFIFLKDYVSVNIFKLTVVIALRQV